MLGKRCEQAALVAGHWDLVVVGGGITGAGIALLAARLGKKVLLLEQRDFAWGTSSRSSKMVHGGLRYLAQGDLRLTRHSLLERERLLRDLPELVVRKTYLFPVRAGQFPGRWGMKAALWLYDFLAGIRDHSWLPLANLRQRLPQLRLEGVKGAMSYTDALTDDCRLVLRVLHEAVAVGATLANYTRVDAVAQVDKGLRLTLTDVETGNSFITTARQVVNATGAFADRLSGADARVRPQRGSHLFFTQERLPVSDCLTLMHPRDQRPVFLFPWQGVTCVGTTDLDHKTRLDEEASASQEEVDYLLEAIHSAFPGYHITAADILSCMAGVRPIIASGKGRDPSKERRDHAIWEQGGVITVSGGKLTTFRLIALDVLLAAGLVSKAEHKAAQTEKTSLFQHKLPFDFGNPLKALPQGDELDARIEWILANEMVEHLDDLMLRRTRLGNLLPQGGRAQLERIRTLCQTQLGWSDNRWQGEVSRYLDIVSRYYQPPGTQLQVPVVQADTPRAMP
jgi:glycerol-3-phosphate dehydrogenase